MKILANKNGFVLAHDEYYGDYCFGTEREIKNLSMPCNQYGTKKEIKAELERWKKEVDFDNPRMYRPPKVRPKNLTIGGRYFYG